MYLQDNGMYKKCTCITENVWYKVTLGAVVEFVCDSRTLGCVWRELV